MRLVQATCCSVHRLSASPWVLRSSSSTPPTITHFESNFVSNRIVLFLGRRILGCISNASKTLCTSRAWRMADSARYKEERSQSPLSSFLYSLLIPTRNLHACVGGYYWISSKEVLFLSVHLLCRGGYAIMLWWLWVYDDSGHDDGRSCVMFESSRTFFWLILCWTCLFRWAIWGCASEDAAGFPRTAIYLQSSPVIFFSDHFIP